jgi:hypothetical protein
MMLDLVALVHEYIALSAGMQFEAKRAFWDAEEALPLLKPEEEVSPLIGWHAIDAYWHRTRGAVTDLESRCRDIVVTALSAEIALAHFHLEWRATIDAPFLNGGALGAHVRVLAAFRRKPEGWRLFCYVESHIDAAAYVQAINVSRAEKAR